MKKKEQICSVCKKPILKGSAGSVIYNIDNDGNIACEACEKARKKERRIAAMEKTFDEPLHRK
jgi:uncharacterized protein with PIN domain